jgi:hypothetical protein
MRVMRVSAAARRPSQPEAPPRSNQETPPGINQSDSDIGFEAGSPAIYHYGTRGTKFSGEVNWVEIDVDKDAEDFDHLITPEERLHVAMARQ